MAKKLIIGLVGSKGSGKGTFTPLLRKIAHSHHIELIKTVDILFDTLDMWDMDASRENLQKLAISMTQTFGGDAITRAIAHKIERSKADVVIIDSMRLQSDVEAMRDHKGIIVYIQASPKVRFERLINRNEKVGEAEMTYEQFMQEELAATEVLIPEIGAQADFIINNEGSFKEFENQVKDFSKNYLAD
jgi:dephospho-CoA kinase